MTGLIVMKEKFQAILKSFKETLVDGNIPVYHRLQNIIFAAACAGSLIFTLMSCFVYDNKLAVLSNVVCCMATMVMLYVSAILKKADHASVMLFAVFTLFFFPSLYALNGGYESGMVVWYMLVLTFPWIAVKGKRSYIMFAAGVVSACACIGYQLNNPDKIVVPVNDHAVAVDFALSLITVSLILGFIFRYQAYLYEKQQAQMAKKDEEIQKVIEKLRKETNLKSAFLAQMSHEIRTPINAVLGMDEMILRESHNEAILEYADNIRSAGQSLLSIINDILDFSKIESGKLEIIPVNYYISDVVDYCQRLIEIRARDKNLEFRTVVDEYMPSVLYGDEMRIRQILINLLSNAVKYTSHGYVELKVGYEFIEGSSDTIMLCCDVADTGMGIDEESQKTLFDAFVRADETENRNIEGTGLGLAITRQLSELMHGSVSVKSEKGKGSVFSVRIPQKAAVELSERKPQHSEAENRNEGLYAPEAHILVVDDVKMNIDVFKGLLKKTAVKIDTAYSGVECLGLMKTNSYDVVFMDHLMPEMDGTETLKRLREQSDETGMNIDVPVIALTANAMSGAYEMYLSYGFSDYLSKPVKGAELEAMLKKHLPERLISEKKTEFAAHSEKNNSGDLNVESAFLDVHAGISACGGDEALYRTILKLYCSGSKVDRLCRLYAEKNREGYLLCIQRIKSDSGNIGAQTVFMAAQKLEAALRCGNTDYIVKNHSTFVKEYEMTLKEINRILTVFGGDNNDI